MDEFESRAECASKLRLQTGSVLRDDRDGLGQLYATKDLLLATLGASLKIAMSIA